MRVLRANQVSTLLDMVGAAEQHVGLLERDLLGFGHEEPDEGSEHATDACEHVEGVKATVVEEGREKLLHDGVGDVLRLRGHADSLRAHIHGEDFGGPDPGRCTPRWFVCEKDQQREWVGGSRELRLTEESEHE